MFHQGTCSKDKALNEAHMNHMENYNKRLPSMKVTHRGLKRLNQLQDEEFAFTQELEVKQD